MLKLHHAPHTRGMRVLWLCEEMGMPYELAPVPFPPDAAYRARHPLGAVPLLEDGDTVINESVAMLLYLAQRYGPTPLLPSPTEPDFARVLQFVVFGEASLTMWVTVMNSALFFAPAEDKQNWSVGDAANRVAAAVDYLGAELGERAFIAGERFTVADISCAFGLGVWRRLHRRKLPDNLAAYLKRAEARPAYGRAYEKQKDIAPATFA